MLEQSYLSKAKTAIRDKNRDKAWRLLHKHISQTPEDVEAWLMLGGLASPESSLAYLRNAEKIAPDDPRVQQAILWANARLEHIPAQGEMSRVEIELEAIDDTQPVSIQPYVVLDNTPSNQEANKKILKVQDDTRKPESKMLTWIKFTALAVLIAIMVFLLAIGVTSLITGNEPQVFGHRIMIVTSGSMEPTFLTGSIILVDVSDSQQHKVGDVVMFWTVEDPEKSITHRIIEITVEDGSRIYRTKGDNNAAPDQAIILDENIIGTYIEVTVPYLGYFFSFIKSRKGILLLAMLFGLFLVVTQVFRIKSLLAQSEET